MEKVVLGFQNFQLIKKGRMVFKPGITMITGPNGSGKTATMRALLALVKNPKRGKYYISVGEKQAAVALQIDNSPPIMWLKGKSSTSYKVGDQTFAKAGVTKLHQIVPTFPFVLDPIKDSAKVLNFHTEWDHLFPFDRKASDIFKLFEDMFQMVDSAIIFKTIEADKVELKKKEVELDVEQDNVENKIDSINVFIKEVDASVAFKLLSRLKILGQKIFNMKKEYKRGYVANSVVEALSKVEKREFKLNRIERSILLSSEYQKACATSEAISYLEKIKKDSFDLDRVARVMELQGAYQKGISYRDINKKLRVVKKKKFKFKPVDSFLVLKQDFEQAEKRDKGIELLSEELKSLYKLATKLKTEYEAIDMCPLCQQPLKGVEHGHND